MLGICPWQIIPYTDASTIAIPIFIVFLYALFRNIKSNCRYLFWFLAIYAGMIGGIIKATCYISVIAVIAVDFLCLFFDKESIPAKLKKLALRIALLLCGFLLASCFKSSIYKTLQYVPDHDLEMTWSNYFYNGLNEATTGACSEDGLVIARAYAGYPKSLRRSVELHYAKDRITEKGFGGTFYFWLRKQVMNFNDGTFSWFQEGYFHAWDYEVLTDSPLKEPLQNFYWEDGSDYIKFSTLSQGIWIFVLLGILFEAVLTFIASLKSKTAEEVSSIRIVNITIFIGVFLFVMLFEARARYLLNNVPVLIMTAVSGYSSFAATVCRR